MDPFTALYINQKVEMLEEICSKERVQAGSSKYKTWIQELQEKRRGMMEEPLHIISELSASEDALCQRTKT